MSNPEPLAVGRRVVEPGAPGQDLDQRLGVVAERRVAVQELGGIGEAAAGRSVFEVNLEVLEQDQAGERLARPLGEVVRGVRGAARAAASQSVSNRRSGRR